MKSTFQLPVWVATSLPAWKILCAVSSTVAGTKEEERSRRDLGLKHGIILLCLVCVCLVVLHFTGEGLRDKTAKRHCCVQRGGKR